MSFICGLNISFRSLNRYAGDHGEIGLKAFVRDHECNHICDALLLGVPHETDFVRPEDEGDAEESESVADNQVETEVKGEADNEDNEDEDDDSNDNTNDKDYSPAQEEQEHLEGDD